MGISLALPIVGSLLGGLIDAHSQSSANDTNAANVDKQIAFQKEQGETQYQRAVADMKAAGLNPALAYQQGGNSAQTGAAAQVQPVTRGTGASISAAAQATSDLKTQEEQRNLLRAQSQAAYANAQNVQADTMIKNIEWAQFSENSNRDAYNKTRMAEVMSRLWNAQHTPERYYADLSSIGAGTAESQSRTRLNEQGYTPEGFRRTVQPWVNATSATLKPFLDAIGGAAALGAGRTKPLNYDEEMGGSADKSGWSSYKRRIYTP